MKCRMSSSVSSVNEGFQILAISGQHLNKKTENLNKIKDEKIIKNPYLILNEYEQ